MKWMGSLVRCCLTYIGDETLGVCWEDMGTHSGDSQLLTRLLELSQFIEPKTLDREKLQPFTKLMVHCRQVNTQIFQMLLDTRCEFTLIPRDQKNHSVPWIKVYGDQWWGSLGLSLRFTLFLFPVPDYGVGIDFLCNCQNHHVCSLTQGVRAIMVGKAKWKALELLHPGGQLQS